MWGINKENVIFYGYYRLPYKSESIVPRPKKIVHNVDT